MCRTHPAAAAAQPAAAAAEPAHLDDEPPMSLVAMPTDLLELIFCACSTASAFGAIAATCSSFQCTLAVSDCWRVLAWQNFDVPLPDLAGPVDSIRRLYRRLHAEEPERLTCSGFLCDGGVDLGDMEGADVNPFALADPAQPVVLNVLPQMAAAFWVSNAFVDSDWQLYCSASGERNVTVVAAVHSEPHDIARQADALEAERARRAYLTARLQYMAQTLWSWAVEGFGGLASCSTETLEHTLLAAWGLPQGRVLLLHGIPAAERSEHVGRLATLVQEVSQREVAALRVFEGRHAGRRLMLDADACLRAAARAAGPARPDFFDRAEPTLLGLEAAAAADARSQEALAATAAASHAATAAAAEVGAPAAEAAAAAEADDEEAVWRASQARHREEMRRPPPRLPCPPGALAVASHVVVRRGVMCSCPVQCGVLLGSLQPLAPADLYGPSMRRWDDLTHHDQLPPETWTRHGPPQPVRLPGVTVAECARRGAPTAAAAEAAADEGGPFPILWFRFDAIDDSREGSEQLNPRGEFRYELAQPRALRYLLCKLISPEDRMEAMQDDHAQPNIDLEFCGMDGWTVRIDEGAV
eukprot:Transcript_30663.p1 GENE.Transcript_30663~~Transcript_30663.p1  ORF type:complete len:600 (+),score=210.35 Transcript_30663:47-1801(+)